MVPALLFSFVAAGCVHVSEAGAPYAYHRAWALPQERSAKKSANGLIWNQITGCIEDYCHYSVQHNCTIDCIVPGHGCQDKCDQNGRRDYKYYVCPSGKLYDDCYPNRFPTGDPECCTYFECGEGLGKGTCNPSRIRIQCERELDTNPKLLGCMKKAWQIPCDGCRSIYDVFKAYVYVRLPNKKVDESQPRKGGDMTVRVPDASRRRQPPLLPGGNPGPVPGLPNPSPRPTPNPPTKPGPSPGGRCAGRRQSCQDSRCCRRRKDACVKKNSTAAYCWRQGRCPSKWACDVLAPGGGPSSPGSGIEPAAEALGAGGALRGRRARRHRSMMFIELARKSSRRGGGLSEGDHLGDPADRAEL